MTWTKERITELCVEYCGRCGVAFDSPVVINGRLTRTLGRCFYKRSESIWSPTKIEISRRLLEVSTDECIEAVIAHECAHYVTCAVTHEDHGHDATFKFYCSQIGADVNTTSYTNLKLTKANEEIYKYTVYCKKCGKIVAGRSRACRLTREPWNFLSACCQEELEVRQNW